MASRPTLGKLALDVLGKVVAGRTRGGRQDRGGGGGRAGGTAASRIEVPRFGTAPADRRDPRRGELPTAEARLQVGYAPAHDGDADPGEVVWAWVPYEDDPTQGKDRPLLVIGHLGEDVAALQLTSRARDDHRHHPIGSGTWDHQGRPSWIKLDRLVRLDPDGIRREGAILDRRRFDGVVAAWEAYED